MHKLLLAGIFAAVLPAGCFPLPDEPPEDQSGPTNVNARYIVDSVSVSSRSNPKLSEQLRSDLDQLTGQNYDQTLLDRLAERIKQELHVPEVRMHVTKADTPDHVTVTFEIGAQREKRFDLDLARFLYHSTQGWSGQGHATINVHGNAFSFGMISDGDLLSERYAGIQAGFERRHVGSDRLQLRFDFASYHEQWNQASLALAAPDDIYRTRTHFSPMATVLIFDPLELSFGVDFARYRLVLPVAKTESSNAVVSTLRYHQRWGSAGDRGEHDLRASYTLRAGTHFLESDPVFARHQTQVRYRLRHDHQELSIGFLAGVISGTAPLFERFVLGNAETLRGWNKFDLDPLGASHVVHGSIDYLYRDFLVFYDTGAVWDRPDQREQKQSLGLGCKKGGFQLAVAFPVRTGTVSPVFYAGMNF
ncbi:MAG TPA: BamA/TamA family outer membrane protein [Bryobacteraceae bacterium]